MERTEEIERVAYCYGRMPENQPALQSGIARLRSM